MTTPTREEQTQLELEAAVFRRLRQHLLQRSDVQNIDLMNLAGFCRNCLANWYVDAAAEHGITLEKAAARERIYGEPYEAWRVKHQREATPEQQAAFVEASQSHAPSNATDHAAAGMELADQHGFQPPQR
jgi:uncharacterized protein